MINTDMHVYNFFTLGDNSGYGMPTVSDSPTGTVKMAINVSSQSIQDNINYLNAEFIGLTHDVKVDDTYIIEYGDYRLKVLYVNPKGRMKQVFMVKM